MKLGLSLPQIGSFADAGRDPANPSITGVRVAPGPAPFVGTIEQIADEIASYVDLGVDELHIDLQFSPGITTISALLDAAERLSAGTAAVLGGGRQVAIHQPIRAREGSR